MADGIVDVARVAGVSTATVSRALRGLPNVSEQTRARVLRAADELGYVPSPSAASLATGQTRTIGLLTPWVSQWFFSHVVEGAERALRAEGYDALLHTFEVAHRPRRVELDPSRLRRRVDGVMVVGLPLEPEEIAGLDELGYPLVFVGPNAPGHVVVGLDDEAVCEQAVGHLAGLGHRVIGHISGEPDDVIAWSPGVRRAHAWRNAMQQRGLSADPSLKVHGHFDVNGGRASMHVLLDTRPDVTAVFAASDEMAIGAILACRDRGLRVPEYISVIGVDGHEMSEHFELSTLAQDPAEQGTAAATLLLGLIAAPRRRQPPADLIIPPTLIERGSTAAPRG